MKWFYLLLILVLVPSVSAAPESPHQFDGSITNNGGTVYAKLCNVQFSVPIVSGQYGLSFPLLVSREDCSNTNIEFFIDGYKIRDYTYTSGGYTQLNLVAYVVNDPPIDNPLVTTQDTSDNTQTSDSSDDSDDGAERDTSHIKPPPDDLVFPEKDVGQEDTLEYTATGLTVYETLTETKLGIATISVVGTVSLLGLFYLLKLFLFL